MLPPVFTIDKEDMISNSLGTRIWIHVVGRRNQNCLSFADNVAILSVKIVTANINL